MEGQGSPFVAGSLLNDIISDDLRASINDRCQQHSRQLDEALCSPREGHRTPEERDIRSRIRERLLDRLGVRQDYERLRALGRGRRFFGGGSATEGVMVWWGSTHWWYPTRDATVWMDGDGVHLAAKFEIDDGDLHKYSIRVVAQYFIGPDRLPARGKTYLSNPAFEVAGEAFGYAFESGIFDFGDEWSKCWLNTTQRVFMVSPEATEPPEPGQIVMSVAFQLAAKSESRRLIFLEDGGVEKVDLPGWMGLPVFFKLPEEAEALQFELEWQFDIQLENVSGLSLGHTDKAPVCTIRHPQWTIIEAS